jgi:uncharacterized protein (TIGR00369 family)
VSESQSPDPRLEAATRFTRGIPHNRDLGMEVVAVGKGSGRMRLPVSEKLVGDPHRNLVFTSVLYSLADSASGLAVGSAIPPREVIATLDLRIDYLRAVPADRDIEAEATCYRLTKQIAFTRCVIHQGNPDDPCAIAVGTFMRASTPARPAKKAAP